MLSLKETLAHHKILISPDFTSPKMQREKSQWLSAYEYKSGDKTVQLVYFGCYKTGLSEVWQSDETALTDAEKKELAAQRKLGQSEAKRGREEEMIRVKFDVQAAWPNFIDRGTTDYLTRKKIPDLYGCKIDLNDHGAYLLVPARDASGELWNYQRVYNQKLSAGDKFFLAGAKIEGCFHALTPIHPEGQIYLCEGFATAASIALALQNCSTVISAFNAGNLLPVALSLRARYPKASFIFCADNDQWVWKPTGAQWNPGLEYAARAAEKVNGTVISPRFQSLETKPTDFNDLHLLEGLEAVKEQLLNPKPADTGAIATLKGISEKQIASTLLAQWAGDLVRQDKSLFRYIATHWIELDSYEIDQIKSKINELCANKLPSKTVDSIYRTFFRDVPHVPPGVNLFVPNPKCGNFLDGTLHLSLDASSGVYCLHFREHKREDYLTWVIPVNYKCPRDVKNSLFEALLSEALEGEEDAAGMLRALKQMGGAMLVPTFSQMFFLHGVSGSRKSTIALTLAKLVSSKNMSHCDPANMENFQIEGMIGKLVNLHTDIDDHTALPRGFLKRFEDDTVVQVNRKGKAVVNAMMPRIHIYCANQLPPNFEGQGKAFLRRNTLLEFKRDLTHSEDGRQKDTVRKHYENLIWARGYEGILNWCLEGLDDLVRSGGKFFQPRSSIHAIQNWQAERDPVGEFLECAKAGEIVEKQTQLKLGKNYRIKPAALWLVYVEWYKLVYQVTPKSGRNAFYRHILQRGVKKILIKGYEYFAGIGTFEVELSDF